jgi:hypothetical protein
MRFKLAFLVAAVGLLGVVASATAQRPNQQDQNRGRGGPGRGGPGGGGGMFFGGGGMTQSRLSLLSIAEVRKELELADEQFEAIQKVQDEIREKYFGGRGGGGPGGGGDRGRRGNNNEGAFQVAPADWYFVVAQQPQNQQGQDRGRGGPGGGGFQFSPEQRAEFEKRMQERSREEKSKLAEILLPHQIKRLNEIYIQQAGVSALMDEDIATELGITDAQKSQFTKAREEFEAKRREVAPPGGGGGGGDFDAIRAKVMELSKIRDDQMLAALNSQQKAKFEEMKGKPFAMPEGAGRGGRGPGGGPGRGNRGGNNNNNTNYHRRENPHVHDGSPVSLTGEPFLLPAWYVARHDEHGRPER